VANGYVNDIKTKQATEKTKNCQTLLTMQYPTNTFNKTQLGATGPLTVFNRCMGAKNSDS
jgi:hypothetical protein